MKEINMDNYEETKIEVPTLSIETSCIVSKKFINNFDYSADQSADTSKDEKKND